jgi:hypothetical protein
MVDDLIEYKRELDAGKAAKVRLRNKYVWGGDLLRL